MITDNLLRFSGSTSAGTQTGQTVTGTDTSVVSTNVIDLAPKTSRDIGEGEDLYVNFAVSTAFSGGTSVTFIVETSDAEAFGSGVVTIGTSGAVAIASLTAGTNIPVRINPQWASVGKRYVRCKYTTVGAVTAGAVFADMVHGIQDGKKFYASGFTVG